MKFFKKSDIIIILTMIAVSVVVWKAYSYFFSDKAAKAEIYYNSQLVETIDLTAGVEKTFSVPGKPNVVFHLDKEGNIKFEKSDCPDQVCVHAGEIHMVGQSAACLPNGLVLKIVPLNERSEDDLDIVVGR